MASPNIAFQDPSAPDAYGVPVLNRLEPGLNLFSGFSGGGVSVEFTDRYASNDHIVLVVELSGIAPAASLGIDGGDISFATNGVPLLQASDGQVLSHTDYMNYPRFEASIVPTK